MALTKCKECSNEVSTDATKCPHCGAKLKTGIVTKLLLSSIAIFVLMVGYGMTIPENEREAMSARRMCEKELMPKLIATQYDCNKMYNDIKNKKN